MGQELLILLRHCRKIDLTGAKLDDKDYIIATLPTACPYLTHLNLSQNNFSAVVLRIIFGLPFDPPRCQKLEYFDISKNPSVSIKGLLRWGSRESQRSAHSPNLGVDASANLLMTVKNNEQLTNLHG